MIIVTTYLISKTKIPFFDVFHCHGIYYHYCKNSVTPLSDEFMQDKKLFSNNSGPYVIINSEYGSQCWFMLRRLFVVSTQDAITSGSVYQTRAVNKDLSRLLSKDAKVMPLIRDFNRLLYHAVILHGN